MDGPVDLDALMQKRPPAADELVTPVAPPHIVSKQNQPQIFLIPTPDRLKEDSQLVTLRNTDRQQTHIMIDRYMIGHELQPGQEKELDMTVGDIAAHREKLRPNRGIYMSGHLTGRPLPTHPVIIVDIKPPASARVDDGGGGDNIKPVTPIEPPPSVREPPAEQPRSRR
jgi:hypothetical protein